MILGIDFDNVIADYTGVIKDLVEKDRNLTSGSLPEPEDWNFESWGLTLDQFKTYHTKFINEDLTSQMKPFASALNQLDHLAKEGHIIKIITQRVSSDWFSTEMREQIKAVTIKWLSDRNVHYDEIHFVKNKEEITADLYIDDSPEVLSSLEKAGKNYIIFNYLYNKENKGSRAYTWIQLKQMIQILHRNQQLSQQK